jgi:hypothetical protein
MAKYANLVRTISVLIFSVVCVKVSISQTSYYVDPNYSGGSRNGSSTNPWQSLSDGSAMGTINSALASGPVTVYFNACNTACTANVVTTTPISINRTDSSSNLLTLDGISKYNTSESSPSWSSNVTPAPCKGFRCAAVFLSGAHVFQVGVAGTGVDDPISSTATYNSCQGYITIQGFRVYRSEDQIANLTYIHDLTVQYVEGSAVPGGSNGPGVYVGPANNGPCHTGAARPNGTDSGPDNVTVQYNYFHDTYEDCFYDGASTPDPPGNGGSEYSSLGLSCGTACSTGAHHVIQYNTLESCSDAGGTENVGINIKDGHSSLTVKGNTIRPTFASFSPSALGPGINLESGGLISSNYIEAPATVAIAPQLGWNNTIGRSSLSIENNIIVNVNSGVGHNSGIEVFGPNPGANQLWQAVGIYNNSIYNAGVSGGYPCIAVDSGITSSAIVVVQNNIMDDCNAGAAGFTASSGTLAAHSYNLYYQASALNGAGCSGSETGVVCANPLFVSTGAPYLDTNFGLQAASPAVGAGADLSSLFTTDYFGNTRTMPWGMSAIAESTSAGPNPPTGLLATVE